MSMTRPATIAIVVCAVLIASLAAAQQSPDLTIIDHVNIIDGNGGQVIRDGVIVVLAC
jgi:hypothetical protein